MKITVVKGGVKFEYEEPQKETDYPRIASKDYHEFLMDAVKLICEQVINISK